MKREEILFYLREGCITLYQVGNRREYIYKVDTSLFFKWGEISDVNVLQEIVGKLVTKLNLGLFYLKPNVVVLYNDVCMCDIKFLYKSALLPLGYNRVSFVPLSKVARMVKETDALVVSEGDCYTFIKDRYKQASLDGCGFEPIVIGKCEGDHIHFADEDIVFKTFKSCFTKRGKYDIIELGDDGF